LNHLDKRTGAAIQNGQLQIVQLDDGIVDADASKRGEQVSTPFFIRLVA
jgi:hypothetical protein